MEGHLVENVLVNRKTKNCFVSTDEVRMANSTSSMKMNPNEKAELNSTLAGGNILRVAR